MADVSVNVRVLARFRPMNAVEASREGQLCALFPSPQSVKIYRQGVPKQEALPADREYTFDRVFAVNDTQDTVYAEFSPAIADVLQGFNATIFAYGQTGSGKTFSMFGSNVRDPKNRGIIPRAASHIFDHVRSAAAGYEFIIKISFMEIYQERVRDLLQPAVSDSLRIRESTDRGVFVENLTEECVSSEDDVLTLISHGERNRTTASTRMNEVSSRSHSLLLVSVQQREPMGGLKTGVLNLADLAGSEKVNKTGATGERLEEAKAINQSLSALGLCIHALTSRAAHVPYRDSKLTFILRESLGGNSKTSLLVTCSPHVYNVEETLSTLEFASRAKTIKLKAHVNKQLSVAELTAIVAQLRAEKAALEAHIASLAQQLAARGIVVPLSPAAAAAAAGDGASDAGTRPVDTSLAAGLDASAEDVPSDDESVSVPQLLDADALERTRQETQQLQVSAAAEQAQAAADLELARQKTLTAAALRDAAEVARDAAQARLQEARAALESVQAAAREAQAAGFRRVAKRESELADAQAACDEAQASVSQLQAQLLELRSDSQSAAALQSELAALQASVLQTEAEVRALRAELSASQQRTAAHRTVIESLEAGLLAAQRAAAVAASEVAALNERKASLESERRALQTELEDVLSRRVINRTVRTVMGGKKSVLRAISKQPTLVSLLQPTKQGLVRRRSPPPAAVYWAALRAEYLYLLKDPSDLVPVDVLCLEFATVARGAEPYMLVLTLQQPEQAVHVLVLDSDESLQDWLTDLQAAIDHAARQAQSSGGQYSRVLQGRITAMDACEDALFVGTAAGQLVRYGITIGPDADGKAAFTMTSVEHRQITERQAAVVDVHAALTVLRVFALCERSLAHYDALKLDDPVLCASGVDTFCLDSDSASPDRPLRVCVVRGEEVVLGRLGMAGRVDWGDALHAPKPVAVRLRGDTLVVAHDIAQHPYSILRASTGQRVAALAMTMTAPARMIDLVAVEGVVVLGARNTVQMLHEDGQPTRPGIALSDTPNAMAMCGDTAVALLPDCAEFVDVSTMSVRRSRAVRNGTVLAIAGPYAFAATSSDICLLDPSSGEAMESRGRTATLLAVK